MRKTPNKGEERSMIDCHIHYAESLCAERLNQLIDKQSMQGAL